MERAELGRGAAVCFMLRKIYNANSIYSQEGKISTFSISRMPTQNEVEQAGKLTRCVRDSYLRGTKGNKLRIISPSERHVLTAFALQAQVNLLATLHDIAKAQNYSEFLELKALIRQESASGKLDFSPLFEELKVYRALFLEGVVSAVEELEKLQKTPLN